MSGTKSPSLTEPRTKPRPSLWKLGFLLYPFAAPAVAINLFMLGLLAEYAGFAAFSPVLALWLSLPLGVPAAWLAARWARSLLEQADG